MKYSPKLKKAMKEIEDVIKKYDVGGFVLLHDVPGFSEYLVRVDPSYSALFWTPAGQLRVRIKAAEIGQEEAKRKAEGTYNMVVHFADMLAQHAILFSNLEEQLEKQWDTEKFRGDQSSQTEQDN